LSDKFEEYRRYAEFCTRMSRTARTLDLRASWLKMADHWDALMRPLRETGASAMESGPEETLARSASLDNSAPAEPVELPYVPAEVISGS
jgi:hypothetical protein